MHLKTRVAVLLCGIAATSAATGQSTVAPIDQRVGKLEKEMKAVQRTVFPNGAPVQPEISAAPSPEPGGNPATSPISDLTARVDALEKALASLTGQVEQASFQNRQQDDAIKRVEARLGGGSDVVPDAGPATTPAVPGPDPSTAPVTTPSPVALQTGPTAVRKPPVVATRNDPARRAAVAAVEIPATGDTAEDAYTYGFRLYSAKFYPEAQVRLKEFVAKYPGHRRASYAQNLLGRAYYDEGKPALASVAFYDNYQKMPKGERAPESLYWLGQALIKLKKLPDACKVYDELQEVYGPTLSPDARARAAKGRADAKCAA